MNKSGIVLIVIGVVLLAHNLGWLAWDWIARWWPALLIGLGIWSIVTHKRGRDESLSGDSKADKQS